MKTFQHTLLAVSLFALLPGCTGEVLDVDDDNSTGGASSGGGGNEPIVYRGYAKWLLAFGSTTTSEDGTDLVLTLSSLSATGATGTVVIGNGTPPPVDPTKFYPPPNPYASGASATIISGFGYSIVDAQRTDDRLQFRIQPTDAFAEWCEAQTPILQPEGMSAPYSCIPYKDGGLDCSGGDYSACVGSYPGQPNVTMSHDMWAMCGSSICTCTADGCAANPSGASMSFDLRFEDGDEELNDVVNEIYLTRE